MTPSSTPHSRSSPVADGWAYGLPELCTGQRDAIRSARRVSGPGCFASGVILALRPLVELKILAPDAPICIQGIGGYSAGGKRMIEWYEHPRDDTPPAHVQVFGLDLEHAQVPDMQRHAGLQRPPLFVPCVGNFRHGTLVTIPCTGTGCGPTRGPPRLGKPTESTVGRRGALAHPTRHSSVPQQAQSPQRCVRAFAEGGAPTGVSRRMISRKAARRNGSLNAPSDRRAAATAPASFFSL